jgi:hypothetical protein
MLTYNWLGFASLSSLRNTSSLKTSVLKLEKISVVTITRGFLFMLGALIVLEVVTISNIYLVLGEVQRVENNPTASLQSIEKLYAFVFNHLFFANALGGTGAFNSDVFWSFIEARCTPLMNRSRCYKDYPFSVGDCVVDEYTCTATQQGDGPACPYTLCRDQVSSFATEYIYYLSIVFLAFVLLHVLTFALTLAVYVNRDNEFRNGEDGLDLMVDETKLGQETGRRTYSSSVDRESPRFVVQIGSTDGSSPNYFKENILKDSNAAPLPIFQTPPRKPNFNRLRLPLSVSNDDDDAVSTSPLHDPEAGFWKVENEGEDVFGDDEVSLIVDRSFVAEDGDDDTDSSLPTDDRYRNV